MIQPYQNYAVPQMNPYQNNFNQNMPMAMQNPYMDRMAQLQNYQQNLQQPMQQMQANQQASNLSCAIIDDFSSIVANDVPMDGRGAVFMKRDGSEMQWRNWSANGTIVTTSYLPVIEQNQSDGTNIPQSDFTALNEGINAFREEILSRLDSIEKSVTKPTASRAKKGDSENE